MSAAPELFAPQTAAKSAARPRLRVVESRRERMGSGLFGLLIGGMLGGSLLVVLMLNTVLAQGAFAMHDLERQVSDLKVRQQALSQSVAELGSPDSLAKRARALGMVRAKSVAYLRLSDRRVLGVMVPATAPADPVAPVAPEPAPAVPEPGPVGGAKPSTKPAPSAKPAASMKPESSAKPDAGPKPAGGAVGDAAAAVPAVPAPEGAEVAASGDGAGSAP